MTKKKTHFEYISEVKLIAPNIEVIDKYINANTKIKHRCIICGYEWNVKPNSVLNGRGCPECAKYQRAKSNIKTHEQYVNEVASVNQNIKIIGRYIHSNEKIKVECKLCGHKWSARAADILAGHGCIKCSHKRKTKTQDQYISELATVNPDIIVIGKYINSHTKIKHFCMKCRHEWDVEPNALLQGNHCPQCSARRKSHNQYITELAIKNPNVEVIEEYVGANINIKHRCTVCGHEWKVKPSHILYGLGCPSCKETSGEQQIRQWLVTNDIEYEYQKRFIDCKNQRMLPFDFYLPNYNCCIEYDGKQHFEEVNHWGGKEYLLQRQYDDQIKNDYCNKNNIYLIRIRYDEDIYDVLNNRLGYVALNMTL